ncbi:DUF4145 domain-containing protein [Bacillus sp. NP157]|nr:DUF4145 domain-containing protein [Bacillus sp. NP157]
MSGKAASVYEEAFNCPYCGAFTAQTWHGVYLRPPSTGRLPTLITPQEAFSYRIVIDSETNQSEDQRQKRHAILDRLAQGLLTSERVNENVSRKLSNLFISECYICHEFAIWRYDRLIYPAEQVGEVANSDMPSDVRADFDEAGAILNLSPRGAAALLRLALQKLCVHLGEAGRNINDDIAALVRKGLPVELQQALDAVRVIGNEAVHPGVIDLRDDAATVAGLMRVLNVVVENRISQPRQIRELYSMLPADKIAGIEARDSRTRSEN